ncbi:ABC transporter permease [Microbacterium saperdae]
MRYLRLAGARIGQLLLVLLAVTLAVFILTQVAPGDAARLRLGPRASEEAVAALRHELGLDRPAIVQYFDYLGRVLRGDLGKSVDGRPVTEIIGQGISSTLLLVVSVLVVSLIAAVVIAVTAALKRDTGFDHVLRLALLLSLFLPTFWVGFLLLRFVAIPTGWFPVAGLGTTPQTLLLSLVLPAVAGATALTPVLARSLRSSLVDVFDSEYISVARSLGIRGPAFYGRHVLRNAAGPVVTLLALNVGYLFFGVVILEATFNIPGLGSSLVRASATQDVFVVQGITLVFAIGVVIANFAGEVLSGLLDPRGARS